MFALWVALVSHPAHGADGDVSPLVPKLEAERSGKHDADEAGMHFQPGKGLTVKSDDGLFSLALGFRADFLYLVSDDPTVEPEELRTTQEVQIRRARITASGNMWGKDSKYKIELAISPRDESVDDTGYLRQTPLLSWEHHFTHLRDLSMRVGQYKIAYSRERVVSSAKLAMVDRSLSNSVFNLDRDIGIELFSEDLGGADLLQYALGVYAGEGRGRFESNDLGLMYLARVNLTPGGTFDDYEPQDFDRTGPRFSLGAAWAFVDQPHGEKSILAGGPADAVYDYHNATVDALFKAYGFSTEAAVFWRDGGEPLAVFAETGTGFYVQPGLLIPHQPIGLNARYGQIVPEQGGALEAATEVGPGVSWYLHGARNAMKLQGDVLWIGGEGLSDPHTQGRLQLQAML